MTCRNDDAKGRRARAALTTASRRRVVEKADVFVAVLYSATTAAAAVAEDAVVRCQGAVWTGRAVK